MLLCSGHTLPNCAYFVALVSAETEQTIFTDAFLCAAASGPASAPPIVLAALDNVEARHYLDGRCVANRLAMFESGTQGTKGHTQVVLPGLTDSYSSQREGSATSAGGPADAIPYCTLKSFPAKPTDCIEWAREKVCGACSPLQLLINIFD